MVDMRFLRTFLRTYQMPSPGKMSQSTVLCVMLGFASKSGQHVITGVLSAVQSEHII